MSASPPPALVAEGLGKRYGRVWGLRDCSLTIPVGRVVGLVGAGGLGLILQEYVGLFLYPDLAMWVIVVVIMTTAIDYSSAAIRRRII